MVPIAAFLAGALLSLLLPVLLLIALAVWYLMFLRRVPENQVPDASHPAGQRAAEAGMGTGSASPEG